MGKRLIACLRELARAHVVVDGGRPRFDQPEVEPLSHPIQVLGPPVHPGRKRTGERRGHQGRLGAGRGVRHDGSTLRSVWFAQDGAVRLAHLIEPLHRVGRRVLVRVARDGVVIIRKLHGVCRRRRLQPEHNVRVLDLH